MNMKGLVLPTSTQQTTKELDARFVELSTKVINNEPMTALESAEFNRLFDTCFLERLA
jgi:hypothetical protein